MDDLTPYKNMLRIVYHPMYATSYATAGCESPERVTSMMGGAAGLTIVKPRQCADDDILRCHSKDLLEREKNIPDRFKTACMAAGGAIMAAELAMEGYIAFAVVRPPGHHANPDHNWGFCFFNNMAICIKKLIAEKRIRSATILDIDLHFGDGTDAIFRPLENVQVFNIQSSNPEDFLDETRRALNSAADSDIIGISAGFDQYVLDWGGNLSTGDYYIVGEIAGRFAADKTKGRIFGILEGGYYIPDLGKNLVSLLSGICRGVSSPP